MSPFASPRFPGFLATCCSILGACVAASAAQTHSEYLKATELIDKDHPSILRIVEPLNDKGYSDQQKAVAIHQFVRDRVDYEFGHKFYDHKASEVLRSRMGFCNPKTTLFVAMLRAAGIPARPHFVEINAKILHGILDPGTPWIDHSYTEVWLDGRWIGVDSYIVDPPLFRAGQKRVREEGLTYGYGVHRNGTMEWDGNGPSFAQYVKQGPKGDLWNREYGVYDDVVTFYAHNPDAWNEMSTGMRVFFGVAAVTFNEKLRVLRREGRESRLRLFRSDS